MSFSITHSSADLSYLQEGTLMDGFYISAGERAAADDARIERERQSDVSGIVVAWAAGHGASHD